MIRAIACLAVVVEAVVAAVVAAVVCACAPSASGDEPPKDEGACTSDEECAPGVCELRSGVCLVDECASDCDADRVCAAYGRERRCEPFGARGDRCFASDDLGGDVDFEKPCAVGLECVIASVAFSAEGLCVPPSSRVEGEPCRSNNECTPPLGCSSTTQRCARPAGEPCDGPADCASSRCGPDALCAAHECDEPFVACEGDEICGGGDCGLTCAAPGGVGAVCTFGDGTCFAVFPCADGLVCSDLGVCEQA